MNSDIKDFMNIIFFRTLTFLIILSLFYCSSRKNTETAEYKMDQDRILKKGRLVEWAFNNNRMDTVLSDFWNSDSAAFIVNGHKIEGYKNILARFEQRRESKNHMKIHLINDKVIMLTLASAIHMASFDQIVEDSLNRKKHFKGTWTTVYHFMDNHWTVINLHESFYPLD